MVVGARDGWSVVVSGGGDSGGGSALLSVYLYWHISCELN